MNRDAVSSFLGLAGFVVLIAGLTVAGVQEGNDRSGAILVALGAGALAVCAVMNARQLLAFGRSRSARYGTNALLMTIFFTAILVVIQAISVRNREQFDFTRDQRFTLAPQTVSILEAMDREVTAYAFFRRGGAPEESARELLELYAQRSERFRFEFIDPDRRPREADRRGASYDEIVVVSGDRSRVVGVTSEEKLTNALAQVTRGAFKTVYFVVGHAERRIDDGDRSGYTSARAGLESDGYTVREIALLNVEVIPEDCEVLVIAGPRKAYLDAEVRRIDAYLDAGGAAMFLIDPRMELPGIERTLGGFGIALPDMVILDDLVLIDEGDRTFDATVTKVRRYEPHPITDGFNAITMYPMARPVRIVAEDTDIRIEAAYLGVTDEGAWGEVDMESFRVGQATRDGDDIAGPLPVSAAVTRTPLLRPPGNESPPQEAARIVVVGDADFANNAFFGLLGNSDFFLNCVGFLAGDDDLISIRARDATRDRVFITASQGRLIFALSIILLPLSVLVIGLSVFVRNRRD